MCVVTLIRLVRQESVRFQHHALKVAGKLTRFGWIVVAVFGANLAFAAHS